MRTSTVNMLNAHLESMTGEQFEDAEYVSKFFESRGISTLVYDDCYVLIADNAIGITDGQEIDSKASMRLDALVSYIKTWFYEYRDRGAVGIAINCKNHDVSWETMELAREEFDPGKFNHSFMGRSGGNLVLIGYNGSSKADIDGLTTIPEVIYFLESIGEVHGDESMLTDLKSIVAQVENFRTLYDYEETDDSEVLED